MREKYIETNLKKKELDKLLDEIKARSDAFSIVRYYDGYMDINDFEKMQSEFYDMIASSHQKRIHDYQYNVDGYKDELNHFFHFENERDAYGYFEELYNQDREVYQDCQYYEFKNKPIDSLNIPENILIKKEYTRITPVTAGPVFELITLSMEAFDDVVKNMKKLFSTYHVFGSEFEDLCCYKEGQVIFKICSHEKFAILYED